MADCRPLAHLDAHLCNDGGSNYPMNAGDTTLATPSPAHRVELSLQIRIHLLEVAIKSVEPVQLDREQLPMKQDADYPTCVKSHPPEWANPGVSTPTA